MTENNNIIGLFKLINECKVNYNKNGIKISDDMKKLLGHILEKDPKKRYTAKQISEDHWLNKK